VAWGSSSKRIDAKQKAACDKPVPWNLAHKRPAFPVNPERSVFVFLFGSVLQAKPNIVSRALDEKNCEHSHHVNNAEGLQVL
jgi:hypothetical protein